MDNIEIKPLEWQRVKGNCIALSDVASTPIGEYRLDVVLRSQVKVVASLDGSVIFRHSFSSSLGNYDEVCRCRRMVVEHYHRQLEYAENKKLAAKLSQLDLGRPIDKIDFIPKDAAVVVVYTDYSNPDFSTFDSFASSIRRAVSDGTFVLFMPMGTSVESLTHDQINSAGLATIGQLNAVIAQRDRLLEALKVFHSEVAEISDSGDAGEYLQEPCKAAASVIAAIASGAPI